MPSIPLIATAALAAVWGWYVIKMPDTPRPISTVARLLRRLPRGPKLVGCAWCLGAWLAISAVLLVHVATGHWSLVVVMEAFAAAGLTGIMGTWLPDDGTPTDA